MVDTSRTSAATEPKTTKMTTPTTRRLFQPISLSVCILLLLQLSTTSSFIAAFSRNSAPQRSQRRSHKKSQHRLPILPRRSSNLPLRATPRPSTTTPPNSATSANGNGSSRSTNTNTAKPRTGFAQTLLNLALSSPIWTYILVPQARATIVKTAEENGIPWNLAKKWLLKQMEASESVDEFGDVPYPEYYRKSFHAYPEGNLSYDAAVEQELAR